jgi:hypothetical protein
VAVVIGTTLYTQIAGSLPQAAGQESIDTSIAPLPATANTTEPHGSRAYQRFFRFPLLTTRLTAPPSSSSVPAAGCCENTLPFLTREE